MSKAIAIILTILSLPSFAQSQARTETNRDAVAKQFTDLMSSRFGHPVKFTTEGDSRTMLVMEDALIKSENGKSFFTQNEVGSFLAKQGFTAMVSTNGSQYWAGEPCATGWCKSDGPFGSKQEVLTWLNAGSSSASQQPTQAQPNGVRIMPQNQRVSKSDAALAQWYGAQGQQWVTKMRTEESQQNQQLKDAIAAYDAGTGPPANYPQEKDYCVKWAHDPQHIKATVAPFHETSAYCPSFLLKETVNGEANMYGRVETEGITLKEKQAAEAAIAQDNAKWAAENFLNTHRCGGLDPRPVSERDADPICIAQKQQEIEQQKRAALELKAVQQRQAEQEQALNRLGIREGQTQAEVKARLAVDGFKMPWLCAGDWSQNVGVSIKGNGEWIAGCSTERPRKDGGTDKIKVFFSVYRRIRYVNADTGAGNLVDQKTDRLLLINYDGK